ncbi:MAG: sulfotransferase [Planctomycetota bacterium]
MPTPATTTPFFIVGNPRSGTNLLKFLTSSHEHLWVQETGFIPYLRVSPDEPMSRAAVRRLLIRIGELNRFWRDMVTDVDAFCDALPAPKLGPLLDALYRQHARGVGAVRWGDRTAAYVSQIARLARIFPDAQFVHIIRDGRDTVLSSMKAMAEGRPYMDHYYLLKHWARRVAAGQAAGRELSADRYHEVRYEQLVADPAPHMQRLCDFLGERFEPAMLDPKTRERFAPKGTNLGKPISTSSVGRWRKEMTPFEQKLADRVVGHDLAALGYELADLGPFSMAERARFLALAAKFTASDAARNALYAVGARKAILWEARSNWRPAAEPVSPAAR